MNGMNVGVLGSLASAREYGKFPRIDASPDGTCLPSSHSPCPKVLLLVGCFGVELGSEGFSLVW